MHHRSRNALISGCSLTIVVLSGCGGTPVNHDGHPSGAAGITITEQERFKQNKQMQAQLESAMMPKAKVVYSTRDIPEGTVIRAEDLEDREIDASKLPPEALSSATLVVGRKCKSGISAGHIIAQHDIAPVGQGH